MAVLLDPDGKIMLGPSGQVTLGTAGDDCDCGCQGDCDIPLTTVDATTAYAVTVIGDITVDGGCDCLDSGDAEWDGLLGLVAANTWNATSPDTGSIAGKSFRNAVLTLVPSDPRVLDGLCPFWYLTIFCNTSETPHLVWEGIKTTNGTIPNYAAGNYTYTAILGGPCVSGTPATLAVS